LLSKLQVIAD